MTEQPSSSPDTNPRRGTSLPRIPSLKSFLPLTSDPGPSLSTRGQNLPFIIQNHQRAQDASPSRRPSAIRVDDDALEAGRYHGLTMPWGGGDRDRGREQRRSSFGTLAGADVLNSSIMRSQRLIGNSNPRYKW